MPESLAVIRHLILTATISALAPLSLAAAEDFATVTDEAAFLELIENKELRHRFVGISLLVEPDGTITGDALGWSVTGTWDWIDGAFCREMDWSGKAIDYNCQLVEVRVATDVRFTVDRGAGEAAVFRLRDR